jgi:hypothetical protein
VLILKPDNYKDINKLGMLIVFTCVFLISIQSISISLKLILIIVLCFYNYYLYIKIKAFKNAKILINDEGHWFLEDATSTIKVDLKEYWIVEKHLFIWLKATNKSISLMISRSIIGEQKFSLLRSKLK